MNITIIAVGKIKEKYFTQAIDEYSKRLSRYCNLNIIEVSDEKAPENLSQADLLSLLEKEGDKIISKIPNGSIVITMEIEGKQLTSEELSQQMQNYATHGQSSLCYIIGGSLGLSDSVKHLSQLKLSFSKLTFPHQMFRVMLLEQVYRGFRIMKGEPYHK
ncbi:MAG: 23S rRNA (pseudouridine(1915)-N(3))-methyltransferase RlmH [Eubacteriales bacterium]